MPHDIVNEALYHDRTVQDWHREQFPRNFWAIDLDLMGVCNRCRAPLYVIEATTNPHKPTSILTQLAKRLDVPGLVIVHNTHDIISATVVIKNKTLSKDALVWGIHQLRTEHSRKCGRDL